MQIKIDRFILFIFIIAFSLRIGYALLEKVPLFIDAVGYDAIAKVHREMDTGPLAER